jgi:peptide deformylase
MILPIVAYGDPVLRKVGSNIDKDYKDLDKLIANMWETMYNAHGVGLAAPQVGKAINLFLVDTSAFEDENYPEVKKVFINSEILEEWGDKWEYEEGCLSIPHIREKVSRHAELKLKYHTTWEHEIIHLIDHWQSVKSSAYRDSDVSSVYYNYYLSQYRTEGIAELYYLLKGGIEDIKNMSQAKEKFQSNLERIQKLVIEKPV